MKFNVLVVAAMVITSVNAAGEGGLLSCFGLGCGPKSRVPRDRQVNEQQPGLSRVPRDSQVNEQQPGSSRLSRNSLSRRLGSVFLSRSSRHGLSKSKKSGPKESKGNGSNALGANELLCYGVVSALKYLHEQMVTIADDSNNQQLVSSSPNDKTDSLKESYDRARKEFVKHGCLTKYPGLLSQDELTEMDRLFY
ncbi:hypothetical protein BASA61_010089 [Batrachochytrium salamandrivorans]|nr:hypothetical protein BASA61_010089 [Batrachochytrium salamandrivorans]